MNNNLIRNGKNHNKQLILFVVLLIIVIVIIVSILLINKDKGIKDNTNDNEIKDNTDNNGIDDGNDKTINLDEYKGTWYIEESDSSDASILMDKLDIKSVDNNIITFDYNLSGLCGENNISLDVNNGIGTFNSSESNGTIEFKDNKIIFKVKNINYDQTFERKFTFLSHQVLQTIDEYVEEVKQSSNEDVIVVDDYNELTDKTLKLDTLEKVKTYSEELSKYSIYAGVKLDNPNVKLASEKELIYLTLMSLHVRENNYECFNKNIVNKVIYDKFDRTDIKGDEIEPKVDGYYCTIPGGGSSPFVFDSEKSINENGIYTYKYVYKYENEQKIVETRFKQLDGLYKLIYYNTTDTNID